jgi:uncharacterized membrane protein YqjE
VVQLIGGIFKDAQTLLTQEVALARAEVAEEARKTTRLLGAAVVGAILTALGTLFLLLTIAFAIALALPLWASFGIVAAALVIPGLCLLGYARSLAGDIHIVPRRTVETLKENAQWIRTLR